jgi:hypothetical protein
VEETGLNIINIGRRKEEELLAWTSESLAGSIGFNLTYTMGWRAFAGW